MHSIISKVGHSFSNNTVLGRNGVISRTCAEVAKLSMDGGERGGETSVSPQARSHPSPGGEIYSLFLLFSQAKDTYSVSYEKLQHQNRFHKEHVRNLQAGSPADLLELLW